MVAAIIFTAVALLDELDFPWARAAIGLVSRALQLEVDYRAMWSSAQGYLSEELGAAWPDLVDAGIVTEADLVAAERPGGGDGRPLAGAPLPSHAGSDRAADSGGAAHPGGAVDSGRPSDAGQPASRGAPSQPPSRAPLPVKPAGEAMDGARQVRDGAQQTMDEAQQVKDGAPQMRDGAPQVRASSEGFAVPVQGTLVYGFGWRVHPIYRKRLFHDGIDVAADKGTPVVSALGGRVTGAGNMGTYGLAVEVAHSDGISTLYAHCSRILVREGQKVARNQKIAEVGSTGLSTGPHLHFEVRRNGNPVDPLGYVKREQIEGR